MKHCSSRKRHEARSQADESNAELLNTSSNKVLNFFLPLSSILPCKEKKNAESSASNIDICHHLSHTMASIENYRNVGCKKNLMHASVVAGKLTLM